MNQLVASDVSIVVPVFNGGADFDQCLSALKSLSPGPGEIIIVDDGSTDESQLKASQAGMRVLHTPHLGPAAARNLGATQAHGSVLLLIDADVEAPADTVATIVAHLQADPSLAALYGSYDKQPPATNFISQFKNLFHHFVHQDASGAASSFWAGCGAIRRDIFLRVGGFSTQYQRPAIEDIELGYRLKKAGYQSRLVKDLQVTHLKRWTLTSLLESDIRQRALPWTRLILRDREFPADLNLKTAHRLSAVLAWVLTLALGATVFYAPALIAVFACAIALVALNWRLYAFFRQERGTVFSIKGLLLHWFYYLYSSLTFAIAMAQFTLASLHAFRHRKQPTEIRPD